MVEGYTAGINRWLRTNKVTDPACRGAGYLRPNARPIDLWYGVYLANLLASTGVFLKQIVDADPPSLDDPGLPELPILPKPSEVDRDKLLKGLGRDPESPFGSNATAVGERDHLDRGRACCWATPTSRGGAATGSPSSTSASRASTTWPAPR